MILSLLIFLEDHLLVGPCDYVAIICFWRKNGCYFQTWTILQKTTSHDLVVVACQQLAQVAKDFFTRTWVWQSSLRFASYWCVQFFLGCVHLRCAKVGRISCPFYHLFVAFFSFDNAYLIGNIDRGKLVKGEVTS
jgi:hypothetical protein